jgi:hypothetical protein
MDNNIFQVTSDMQTQVIERVRKGLQKYLIFIVLIFVIALQVVVRLYKFGFQNAFTEEFFANFTLDTISTTVAYICFYPFGRNGEQLRSLTFMDNFNLWSKLSDIVRTGYLVMFKEFCSEQVAEEREEAKKFIISNCTIIPYEVYKTEYEGKSKADLKALVNDGTITKDDYKAIIKANKVRIKPISALVILSGTSRTSINDAGRTEGSLLWLKAILRPSIAIIVAAVTNSIKAFYIGNGWEMLIQIMLSVLSICIAAISGYSSGGHEFKAYESRVKSRVVFISLFFEKNNIKPNI